MKLKMIKGPRPGQTDMVCMTSKGAVGVKLGEVLEVSDEAGHEILSRWGACFEKHEAPFVEAKVMTNYKKKAVSTDKEEKLSEEDKVIL